MRKLILLLLYCLFGKFIAFSQGNKISITSVSLPTLTACSIADTFSVNLLNITSTSVSNITFHVTLPNGISYVPSSISGGGLTENNISNLSAPVFNVPNMGIGASLSIKFRATASCGIIAWISGSNPVTNTYRTNYTGNFDQLITNPYNVKIPNLIITSVTNQTYNGNFNSSFVRTFTITNTGQGSLSGFNFNQINRSGLQVVSALGGSITSNGDTLKHVFSGTHFSAIGNLNNSFDYLESIIVRDTLKIIACNNLNSVFSVWWGCNNQICQQNGTTGNVILTNQIPNLVVTAQPSINTCYGGTNASVQQLTIRNTGTGLAKDFAITVFQPGNYFSKIDATSFTFKIGVNGTFTSITPSATAAAYNSGAYACLGSSPVGSATLNFATINPADTVFIKWNTYSCCPQNCNGFSALLGWQYNGTYKDQCLTNTYNILTAWGQVYVQGGISYLPAVPSDITTGQTKSFRYIITNYSLLPANNGNSDFELIVTLPAGLRWVSTTFTNPAGSVNWPVASFTYVGNVYKAYFNGPPPFNLTQAELGLNLEADCSMSGAATGNRNIQVNFGHRPNKSCSDTCSVPLMCVTTGVYLHCSSNCFRGGMNFRDYSIVRTSYGLPDNDDNGLPDASGTINLTKIKTERAMVGDTVTATFMGVVRTAGVNTSFQYGYASSTITSGNVLTSLGASVKIKKAINGNTYTCNNVAVTSTLAGTTANFKYDFSIPTISSVGGCVTSGFRYNNNDTVYLILKYKVTGNIGGAITVSNVSNTYYLSNVANPTLAANIYQCDTFSGNYTLIGYYFTNYGRDVYSHNSCNNLTISQSYYLSVGNCCSNYAGGNFFPNEYRSWAHLKRATLVRPPGYTFVSASFNQVRTAGTLVTNTQTMAAITPVNPNSDTLVFNTENYYKGYGGSIDSSDDGFHGTISVVLSPSCAVTPNLQQPFPMTFDFMEHKALSNSVINFPPGGQTDAAIYVPPNITLAVAMDTVKGLNDTAYWDVTVSNTSGSSTASNVWFGFASTPTTTVVSVVDNAGNPVPVVNGIFRLGTLNPSAQRTYKIKATYRSCSKDSIIIYSAANCGTYPASLAAYNCSKVTKVLYVSPQMPGFQATLTDSVSTLPLCAISPYILSVSNIQEASAYNVRVQITVPLGLTLVPGSTRLQYPSSAIYRPLADPLLISGTTYQWDLSVLDTNIQKYGVKGVVDTSRSTFRIKFYVKTDCNYSSGGIFRMRVLSTSQCGTGAPVVQAISNQLKITGITNPYYSLVQMNTDTVNPCSVIGRKFKVHIFNIGNDSTGNNDYYQAILPVGMAFVTSSFNGLYNAPLNPVPNITYVNGQQIIEWKLPAGIQRLDSSGFEFFIQVIDSRQLTCGSADIYSQAVVKQSVLCIATNTNCTINTITGYYLNPIHIQKGNLIFTSINGSAIPNPPSGESVSINYNLKNTGLRMDSVTMLKVQFYYDTDNNGVYSGPDLWLATDSITQTIHSNQTYSGSKTFFAPAGKTCTILAVADTGNCACSLAQTYLLNVKIPLAGSDKILCSGMTDTIGLNPISGYTYSWSPTSGLSNANLSAPAINLINYSAGIQTYTYRLTTNRGNCSYTDTVLVRVYPKISNAAGPDKNICPGDSVRLGMAATGGTAPYTYKWLVTSNLSNDSVYNPWAKPLTTTPYVLRITDSLGCVEFDSVWVNVSPLPNANFGAADVCFGDSTSFFDSTTVALGNVSSWFWNFGDGFTSSLQHPKHKYSSAGNYTVRLKIFTDVGCPDSIQKTIYVRPNPVTSFSAFNTCLGDSVLFINSTTLSSGSVSSWNWDFGDGLTDTSFSPKHVYSIPGKYAVTLRAETTFGCNNEITDSVEISPKPLAGFSSIAGCVYNAVAFSDTSSISSGTITNWLWDFGDSTTSTLQHPTHLYNYPGNKTVKLKVTSLKGCTDSIQVSIMVYPAPVADFIMNNTCKGDSAILTNTSTGGSSFFWEFGDGNTYNGFQTSHLYVVPGNYNIKLLVVNAQGCRDSIIKPITIFPKPVSGFFAVPVCETDSIRFNNTSAITGGNIVSYLWSFGDGNTSTDFAPSYKYNAGGVYNVSLKVTSNLGCTDSLNRSITIYSKPIAAFSASSKCQNQATQFADLSIPGSGSINQWFWDFGDGFTSTSQNPNHNFADTGYHQVKLKITNTNGCKDSLIQNIYINIKPVANFIGPSACIGDNIVFTDSSTIAVGNIQSWVWNFGDGQTSTQQNPIHSYSIAGNYIVTLTIISDSGCTSFIQKLITAFPKPQANFNLLSTCFLDSVTFNDSSTVVSPYSITSWLWRFGDGSISTVKNPKHKYMSAGSYAVTLLAYSNTGCIDSVTKTVTVNPIPQSGFTYSNTCFGDSAQFTDTSTALSPITYRKWYFGDGFVSFQQNPKHKYLTAGTYTVSLVTRIGPSCSDSISKIIIIEPKPTASFTTTDNCSGVSISFTHSSVGNGSAIISSQWDFGDGYSDTGSIVNHSYQSSGIYRVRLTITTDKGCTDTLSKWIVIYSPPVAAFAANNACLGDSTSFTETSVPGSGINTQWFWDFGDGIYSNKRNPKHLFSSAGNHSVTLIVINSKGCSDTLSQVVTINPLPVVSISPIPSSGCRPLNVQFSDNSTASGSSIIKWLWNFGDGTTDTLQNPNHKYTKAGKYTVTLRVQTAQGCFGQEKFDSIITVFDLPQAKFTVKPDSVSYLNPVIECVDSSVDAVLWDWNFGDGQISSSKNPTITLADTGKYNVRLIVYNNNGCSDTAFKIVLVAPDFTFFIPNAFTPNKDNQNINEGWGPEGIFKGLIEYELSIYNRWGEMVFTTTDLMEKWKGNLRQSSNEPAPDGVYIYQIMIRDYYRKPYFYKGNITLLR